VSLQLPGLMRCRTATSCRGTRSPTSLAEDVRTASGTSPSTCQKTRDTVALGETGSGCQRPNREAARSGRRRGNSSPHHPRDIGQVPASLAVTGPHQGQRVQRGQIFDGEPVERPPPRIAASDRVGAFRRTVKWRTGSEARSAPSNASTAGLWRGRRLERRPVLRVERHGSNRGGSDERAEQPGQFGGLGSLAQRARSPRRARREIPLSSSGQAPLVLVPKPGWNGVFGLVDDPTRPVGEVPSRRAEDVDELVAHLFNSLTGVD
jgi:hypothetical protein